MSTNSVSHVGRRILSGLTALGTNQATAFPLLNEGNHQFTTVGSSTGAVLPTAKLPSTVTVWNGGSNALSVYPPSGGKVNDGSVNAAYSVPAGSGISFFATDLGIWYTSSASQASAGTVSSVTFTGDGTVLSATPTAAVTTTGTLTASLANQSANQVLAGPSSGSPAAPAFRALGASDIPKGLLAAFASRNLVM